MNKDKLIESSNAFDKPTPSNGISKKQVIVTIGGLLTILAIGVIGLSINHISVDRTYASLTSEIINAKKNQNTDASDIVDLFNRVSTYDTTCANFHRLEKIDPSVKQKQAKLMHKLDTSKARLAKSGHELDIKIKKQSSGKWKITIKEVKENG